MGLACYFTKRIPVVHPTTLPGVNLRALFVWEKFPRELWAVGFPAPSWKTHFSQTPHGIGMLFHKRVPCSIYYDLARCQLESSLGLGKILMGAIDYFVRHSILSWQTHFSQTPHGIGMLFHKTDPCSTSYDPARCQLESSLGLGKILMGVLSRGVSCSKLADPFLPNAPWDWHVISQEGSLLYILRPCQVSTWELTWFGKKSYGSHTAQDGILKLGRHISAERLIGSAWCFTRVMPILLTTFLPSVSLRAFLVWYEISSIRLFDRFRLHRMGVLETWIQQRKAAEPEQAAEYGTRFSYYCCVKYHPLEPF